MSRAVLSTCWRISSHLRRPVTRGPVSLPRLRATGTTSIFEPLPREELVTKFKSRLRGRQFLAGASEGGFPEFLAEPRDSFPLGVRVNNSNRSSLKELTTKCMEFVEDNFPHSPAILFRNLPAKTAEDFSIIAQTVQMKFTYDGGTANRTFIDKDSGIATASENPDEFTIQTHNEMSYAAVYPSKVFFFCLNEPADGCGGETPLVKNKELVCKLDPEVLQKFEEMQIRYVRYLPREAPGVFPSWPRAFATDSKKDVESLAATKGYHITWEESGNLYLWQNRPAFIRDPLTGEKIWFNQAHNHRASNFKHMPGFPLDVQTPDEKYPAHSYYGDGSEIEREVIQHIRATSWECAVGFQWRSGDLLVLDNLAVQHARIGFTGNRKILAYLTQ